MYKESEGKGFTLIEILVAVAILSALSLVGMSALREFGRRHVLDSSAEAVASALLEAKAKTVASEGGQRYGVHFDDEQAYVFPDSYVAGSSSNRSILPEVGKIRFEQINISGGSDVIFQRLSGQTDNFGSVTLVYAGTSASTTIIIERTGTITIDE